MRIFAVWHGGASYAEPMIPDHVETFSSLQAARDEFESRCDRWATFHYADGRTDETETPCVSRDIPEQGGPEMTVWLYDPRESDDPYPDRLIHFGPKGGILTERC